MSAIMYNGTKYICINRNINKEITLEDEVYCALKDIFLNCDTSDMCTQASLFMDDLVGNVNDQIEFIDTRCLYDINFVKIFLKWLDGITVHWFIPEELQEPPDDPSLYVEFDKWWEDFKNTREKVRERLEKLKEWEEEEVKCDCNRQAELSDYDNDSVLSVD